MSKARVPFRNMIGDQWLNLATAGFLTFYLIQIGLDIVWGNVFSHLSIDFASFWSAGFIANHHGYAGVYDLDLMRQVQTRLWPNTPAAAAGFRVVPTPYLPIFLVPFQLLSLLNPLLASWIWILLNGSLIMLYLRYFVERVSGGIRKPRMVAMMLVSTPVFLNLYTGQVNGWLMICVGQFMLATIDGRPFQAGLWLGGLLLKPQCLILIVPALLIQRSFKASGGLAAAALFAGIASWMLAGTGGLLGLTHLWIGYARGLATNDPQLMMNWRMIGVALEQWAGGPIAWTAAILGLVGSALAALYLWRKRVKADSQLFAVAATGTFAATCLVAWHSHVHMAMILIPPLVYLHLRHPEMPRGALTWWVFFPASVYVARLMMASAMRAGLMPMSAVALDLLAGIGLFVVDLYLLYWAVRQSRQLELLMAVTA
jgi:hypothetical protein